MDPLRRRKPSSFEENLLGNENQLTADTHWFRALGMRFLVTKYETKKVVMRTGKKNTVTRTRNPQQEVMSGKLSMEEALKTPTYWEAAPKKNEYAAMERAAQEWAAAKGISTATYQGRAWVGAGKHTALESPAEPFPRSLEKRVANTAHLMGADPDEVLEKFIHRRIPLLNVGARALAVGATLPGSEDQPPEQSPY